MIAELCENLSPWTSRAHELASPTGRRSVRAEDSPFNYSPAIKNGGIRYAAWRKSQTRTPIKEDRTKARERGAIQRTGRRGRCPDRKQTAGKIGRDERHQEKKRPKKASETVGRYTGVGLEAINDRGGCRSLMRDEPNPPGEEASYHPIPLHSSFLAHFRSAK